ncbi:hypothetical protein KSD_01810 [Ktedonobacter sp. SOSP1-85]|uniref:MarR family transcriptional regulator n=1 Tax=Ktedonobacter sp. SOSP1-85 TaxID=2778367 RepID=UPI00191513F1|nr:MarR family transcriptional regulator [Ktedonobacter sp. SOSP1-85]GHO72410.1 hypothetical protein KSD_01810 [Ktedonobacter sp. SOSP1-85]
MTKGTIVGLLNRLEDRRLAERQTDPQDGRMHVTSLTEQCAGLAAHAVTEHEA